MFSRTSKKQYIIVPTLFQFINRLLLGNSWHKILFGIMKKNKVSFTVGGEHHYLEFSDSNVSMKKTFAEAEIYVRDYIRDKLGMRDNPEFTIDRICTERENL